jgi:hypothetical protein
MDRAIRLALGRSVPAEDPASTVTPEEELRETRFQLAVAACSVLPEAVEDVRELLDWPAIDRDADQAHAIEKGVRALVRAKPYYAGVESADAGAGRSSPFRGFDLRDMNQRIRDAREARFLSPVEAGGVIQLPAGVTPTPGGGS